MLKTLAILSILFLSSCTNLNKHSEDICVKMMTIKYVDWDIDTPIDIKCDDFESTFPEAQIITIKDSTQINQILNMLKNLKNAGEENYRHVDTRLKLEIRYCSDSIETICMDRFTIDRNNKLLLNSDTLKSLLTTIK